MNQIQAKVLSSKAVNHPYLKALSEGTLPNMREAIRDYALQYRGYSRSFIQYVETLMEQLDSTRKEQLRHNLDEEIGKVDDEELLNAGVNPDWVRNIRHTELFDQFRRSIGITQDMIDSVEYVPEVIEWRESMLKLCSERAAGIGALGLGTELLVSSIYRHLLTAINTSFPELHPRDYVFFPLHVFCDDDHSQTLIEMAQQEIENGNEQQVLTGCDLALKYRAKFWDVMLQRALAMKPSQEKNVPREADQLYDSQANNWARVEPVCLSDFTARPKVLHELCGDVAGCEILDMGCGDGYCARIMAEHGAKLIVAMDISEQMVNAGKEQEKKRPMGIQYYAANALNLLETLKKQGAPQQYDLIVAVFLFNYVTCAEMQEIMTQAYTLLRPNGRFVFSVPHPAFPFWKRDSTSANGYPFVFNMDENNSSAYFDAKDQLFQGRIWRKDGKELHVQLVHKTLEDYFTCLNAAGFVNSMPVVQELHADADLQKRMPEFVGNLKGIPLHLGFQVQKSPVTITSDVIQSQLVWPKQMNPEESIVEISQNLMDEFVACIQSHLPLDVESLALYDENKALQISHPTKVGISYFLSDGSKIISPELNDFLVQLGTRVKQSLNFSQGLGFVHLKGFDVNRFQGTENQDNAISLFYYLVSIYSSGSLIVKRGRLYDVVDRGLDVNGEDVLFSATKARSTFHTDSTDRDVFPDIVGLACVQQCQHPDQGYLELVNAAQVYMNLSLKHAKRLKQPIIRDLIDKGMGQGTPKALERLLANRFPVFAKTAASPLTFRYMRFWIEAGYMKTGQVIDEELMDAMDALDYQLEKAQHHVRVRLNRGEMIWCNNHVLAHNRDAFEDLPGHPKRHMKRVWMNFK